MYTHMSTSIYKNEEEDWSVLERSIDRLFLDRSLRISQWDEEDAAPLYVEDSGFNPRGIHFKTPLSISIEMQARRRPRGFRPARLTRFKI